MTEKEIEYILKQPNINTLLYEAELARREDQERFIKRVPPFVPRDKGVWIHTGNGMWEKAKDKFCSDGLKYEVVMFDNMKEIEFVNYTGKYPCLCMGVLTLKIDGKEMSFSGHFSSGGTCYFDADWDEHITKGEWEIDFDSPKWEELNLTDEEKQYIIRLFNENVANGCCGGCL